MKILNIISTGYVAGGAENIVVKITSSLRARGHSVKTLASDLGPDKEHFNDYTFSSINSSNPATLLLFLFNPSSFLLLKKVLKEYQPDIVHLHTMHQVTPSVLFLLKNYPTVMTLHGPETFISKLLLWCIRPVDLNYFYDKGHLNLMGRVSFVFNHIQSLIYKAGIKNVDLFIAPSQYIQEAARRDHPTASVHLPNFVELKPCCELQHQYHLLYVGRVERVKGIEFLLQAMPSIIEVFPQTTLTIVGDGNYKQHLVTLARNLQLERHIHFAGWIANSDLATYYARASVVVVPSIWPEAFGVVALEAMMMGRPVIASHIGGLAEVIDDGINGYLVEPQHPAQIAEKVIKLFSEEDVLKALGKNARQKAEKFSLEHYTESILKIYEDVVKNTLRIKHSATSPASACPTIQPHPTPDNP